MSTHAVDSDAMAAVLTAGGRGAVATVRLVAQEPILESATQRLFRAANGKPMGQQPHNRTVFGRWGDTVREDVVLCRLDDRTTEIHCHGGQSATRRILDGLSESGVTIVSGHELLAVTAGVFAAENELALSKTRTVRTTELVLEQINGTLAAALHSLIDDPLTPAAQKTLQSLITWAEFGQRLTQPWRVAIIGRPNVGKSSLINALAGYSRSIVYDQPGTTRDVVTVEIALDGWPFELFDTAGIRVTDEKLESSGIELARQAMEVADCRVLLFDSSQPMNDDDNELLRTVDAQVLVASKADLQVAWTDEKMISVSSQTGQGMNALTAKIVDTVIPETPPAGTAIPLTVRQHQLLQQAHNAVAAKHTEIAKRSLGEILGI